MTRCIATEWDDETGGILPRADGTTIAYRRVTGKSPGVVFLHGLRSDMTGTKASALARHCHESGRAYLRFDLSGHGQSGGRFEDGTIGAWAGDAVLVLDALTEGPQILVGSSLGGWIMLLAALARPDRVAALLGLAAAPDFTQGMMDAASPEQRAEMAASGRVMIPDCTGGAPYPITARLIEEGRNHLLLRRKIDIHCPLRLIQGKADHDVPWQTALRLEECVDSDDVTTLLIKSAGHRLSEPAELKLIRRTLDELVELVERGDTHPPG